MRCRSLLAFPLMISMACSRAPAEATAVVAAAPAPATSAPAAARPAIVIDGSSTVDPINRNVVERYHRFSKNEVKLAVSGTGGGFRVFCRGGADINGASRPITRAEMKECAASKVELVELPIAFDGIVVVVPRDNDWVKSLTVAELKRLWEPAAQGKILKWSDARRDWPAVRLHLVGPGSDSGTFDYFTKAIVGTEDESRRDYFASEDDSALVEAVARDGTALGFFGFAYYMKNQQRLRAIPIDDGVKTNGVGPIAPSVQSIKDASYQPLSRPLFIYVSVASLARPEVEDFVRFYVEALSAASAEAGYIPLPRRAQQLVARRLEQRRRGSTFSGEGTELGMTIETLLEAYHVEVTQR